jgi:hypothetical protein
MNNKISNNDYTNELLTSCFEEQHYTIKQFYRRINSVGVKHIIRR